MFLLLLALAFLFQGCAHKIILPGNKNDDIQRHFTLIHFNDGESHLLNAGAGLEDYGGIARFATTVKEIRRDIKADISSTATLTVSAGNNFLAGPVFHVSLKKGVPYYDALALDMIGVDVFGLGNHDFDFGPDVLADFIRSFHFTKPIFLSANLSVDNELPLFELQDAGRIAGAVILERGGDKFGVIGISPPDIREISTLRNVLVRSDTVRIVRKAVSDLQHAGVNKIILVSHLRDISSEVKLISDTTGIDLVVSGGGKDLLADNDDISSLPCVQKDALESAVCYPLLVKDAKNRTVPVVTTPGSYCYVGRLDVLFDSNGEISEILPQSGLVKVVGDGLKGSVRPDKNINEKVVIPVAKALTTSTTVIGTSKLALDGERDQVRRRETNLGDLVADAVFRSAVENAGKFNAGSPTVAMINAGALRHSIPEGQVTDSAVFTACPFYDFITIIEDVPPQTLKNVLEESVSAAVSGISSEGITGGFPQISNMSIIYNPTRKKGDRIKEIRLQTGDLIVSNYRIVEYAPFVNVATIGYLARGGDGWRFDKGKKINIGISLQDAVSDYISASVVNGGLNKIITRKEYPGEGLNRIMLTRE